MLPLPETVKPVGAEGVGFGVALEELDDDELVPTELVAETLKIYAVPLVSPVTVVEVVEILFAQVVQLVPEFDE